MPTEEEIWASLAIEEGQFDLVDEPTPPPLVEGLDLVEEVMIQTSKLDELAARIEDLETE